MTLDRLARMVNQMGEMMGLFIQAQVQNQAVARTEVMGAIIARPNP